MQSSATKLSVLCKSNIKFNNKMVHKRFKDQYANISCDWTVLYDFVLHILLSNQLKMLL